MFRLFYYHCAAPLFDLSSRKCGQKCIRKHFRGHYYGCIYYGRRDNGNGCMHVILTARLIAASSATSQPASKQCSSAIILMFMIILYCHINEQMKLI